ncbi:META domain-containing protein [Wenzhouxiangella sp. XN79A]|uniref:META domain-containing protein n=1 Tax=Wenzhouxiangella sp. XN79A TaxID=2724193 RepID=UPI00144AC1AE|nr:META domain-containing protein [Wenzhouxiangella sp. XN79A]NKI34206.1 META domain-containing protein [Wenzhouxiangella sp. XN79A]
MRSLSRTALLFAGLLGLSGCTMPNAPDVEPDSGTDPERLTATTWVFETVADQPLPDRVRVTMGFEATEGRVFGRAGCNRYTAGYTLDGADFEVGTAAATKMMCPEAMMQVEDRFLKALDGFRRATIDPATGRLELAGADGARSWAFPAPEGEAD